MLCMVLYVLSYQRPAVDLITLKDVEMHLVSYSTLILKAFVICFLDLFNGKLCRQVSLIDIILWFVADPSKG